MCITCEGQIILRTRDRMEFIEKVSDCDIRSYRKIVPPKMTSSIWRNPEFLPIAVSYTYREYVFHGEIRNGVRILDEVDSSVAPRQKRDIDLIDQLDIKETEDAK